MTLFDVDAIDLCAAAGGWDEAARMLGIRTLGIEVDKTACDTAMAAGHARICGDITTQFPEMFFGVPGLIASPPCTPFSTAGKRLGLKDQVRIYAICDRVLAEIRARNVHARLVEEAIAATRRTHGKWHDPLSPLVLEPLRWILGMHPRWITLEQVKEVQPLWHRTAEILRQLGYNVETATLRAEQYGVPQTRVRAILVASLDHAVTLPAPTHRAYDPYHRDTGETGLFDLDLLPCVTMAQALGWGLPDRPAWTVTSGGSKTGGAEVFAGASSRRELAKYARVQTGNESRQAGGRTERFSRPLDAPAPTVTTMTRSWRMLAAGATSPETAGTRPRDPLAEPAATITGKGTAAYERPATTVQCDPRIAQPGHRDRAGGESQFDGESCQVSPEEAACLQTFPNGYPWHGGKTKKHEQIGNAVPVLLGVAVLGAQHRLAQWRDICRDAYREVAA